jgi:hypothetical protein
MSFIRSILFQRGQKRIGKKRHFSGFPGGDFKEKGLLDIEGRLSYISWRFKSEVRGSKGATGT